MRKFAVFFHERLASFRSLIPDNTPASPLPADLAGARWPGLWVRAAALALCSGSGLTSGHTTGLDMPSNSSPLTGAETKHKGGPCAGPSGSVVGAPVGSIWGSGLPEVSLDRTGKRFSFLSLVLKLLYPGRGWRIHTQDGKGGEAAGSRKPEGGQGHEVLWTPWEEWGGSDQGSAGDRVGVG